MIYDNVRCVHLFQNVNDVSYLNLTKTTIRVTYMNKGGLNYGHEK